MDTEVTLQDVNANVTEEAEASKILTEPYKAESVVGIGIVPPSLEPVIDPEILDDCDPEDIAIALELLIKTANAYLGLLHARANLSQAKCAMDRLIIGF